MLKKQPLPDDGSAASDFASRLSFCRELANRLIDAARRDRTYENRGMPPIKEARLDRQFNSLCNYLNWAFVADDAPSLKQGVETIAATTRVQYLHVLGMWSDVTGAVREASGTVRDSDNFLIEEALLSANIPAIRGALADLVPLTEAQMIRAAREEEADRALPLLEIGRKVKEGGKKGAQIAHGEPVKTEAVVKWLDDYLRANPEESITKARHAAAAAFGRCYDTIRRLTPGYYHPLRPPKNL
jgi:hypothetical protein